MSPTHIAFRHPLLLYSLVCENIVDNGFIFCLYHNLCLMFTYQQLKGLFINLKRVLCSISMHYVQSITNVPTNS